jgi:hypothetical protein
LRPMMPTTSPGATSKLTSLSTHKGSARSLRPLSRATGRLTAATTASRNVGLVLRSRLTLYSLLKFLTVTIGLINFYCRPGAALPPYNVATLIDSQSAGGLDDLDDVILHAPEHERAVDE